MTLYENKALTALLMLIVSIAASTSAAATTDCAVASILQETSDISAVAVCYNEDIEPICSGLADIGRKLRTPPASYIKSDKADSTVSLPAVPQAILMALTGFVCVSLVKDRRFWLVVLCGLFSAGQTGFQVLPQLGEHLKNASHSKHSKSEYAALYFSDVNSSRRRCDIEGTRYISLLHYLDGIPQVKRSSTQLITPRRHCQRLFGRTFSHLNKISPSAIPPEQQGFNLPLKCLTSAVRHSSVFSPGFIFDNLARGPPQSSSMSFQTVGV
jgi:hypothetical protein